jgi:alkanesulfonate monooxygenase SsuD/methylene tetrahydromethanopterin reductase-like flavin-dependent oxidoreductase (luciferase family)
MAAAVTSTIKLATGITLVTERHPLILAKEIAVLDLHSNGRFIFGVGAGWNREERSCIAIMRRIPIGSTRGMISL